MIRVILVGTLLLLCLAFFLQNQEQEVTLRYFFGLFEASTPIYKPILAGFAVGLLVSGILLFPPWVKGRIELRRKTKALQEAEVDLERLRHSLEKLTGRTAPPVPGDVPLRESPMSEHDETPLMRQYREIKRGYPEAILFFRVGDFYEMFYKDAKPPPSCCPLL